MDKEKKTTRIIRVLTGLILLLLITIYLLPSMLDQGWLNKEKRIKVFISRVEFIPGSFEEPRTVIITIIDPLGYMSIRQFKDTTKAIFKAGEYHIIVYRKRNNYDHIINVRISPQ